MRDILFCFCISIIIYTILPNFYYRNLSSVVIKRLPFKSNKIALTFDDGPNQRYTPLLLDLLSKNQIKCTFFVVAKNAMKNRDIITRMVKEGHTIGIHSYRHKSSWLSFPLETKKDFEISLKIMESTGIKITYFRPPWGTFNLLTNYYARRNKLTTVLWSINARDWSKHTSVSDIKEKLINSVTFGDIIVLHDNNGDECAPLRTIKALEEILPELKSKGFKFITLESLKEVN